MKADTNLFKEAEHKSVTLTIRLTPSQKACIYDLVEQKKVTVARFILDLVGNDYDRLYNTHDSTTTTATDPADKETHTSALDSEYTPSCSPNVIDDFSLDLD